MASMIIHGDGKVKKKKLLPVKTTGSVNKQCLLDTPYKIDNDCLLIKHNEWMDGHRDMKTVFPSPQQIQFVLGYEERERK